MNVVSDHPDYHLYSAYNHQLMESMINHYVDLKQFVVQEKQEENRNVVV
jgi:hypothetical protein